MLLLVHLLQRLLTFRIHFAENYETVAYYQAFRPSRPAMAQSAALSTGRTSRAACVGRVQYHQHNEEWF